jgi:hypothetical protein
VCLLAHRFTDVKGKLNDLEKGAQAVGLHLSKGKTKEMRVHNITHTRLQHGEEETEEVDEFVYLGVGGKMGSEWILERLAWGVWIGFDWLRTGTSGRLL